MKLCLKLVKSCSLWCFLHVSVNIVLVQSVSLTLLSLNCNKQTLIGTLFLLFQLMLKCRDKKWYQFWRLQEHVTMCKFNNAIQGNGCCLLPLVTAKEMTFLLKLLFTKMICKINRHILCPQMKEQRLNARSVLWDEDLTLKFPFHQTAIVNSHFV